MNSIQSVRFKKTRLNARIAVALTASVAVFAPQVYAQQQQTNQTDDDASRVEVIQITARKRQETIQDIPGVVNVITGEQLRANGQTDARSLAQNTPGVIYSETFTGASAPRITIRGVGDDDFNPNGSASAAVHVNSVYQGTNGLLNNQYFDVSRVEVLKGPQGTLYGRNATAGAINILTTRPGVKLGGYLDLDIGNFGLYRAEGAVDLPASDTFLIRVAGMYESSDGFYTHQGTGSLGDYSYAPGTITPQVPLAAQGDWGGADRQSVRITAEWEVNTNTIVTSIITLGQDKSELPIPDVTADIWADFSDGVAFFLNPEDPALIEYAAALDNDPFTVFSNSLPQLDSDQLGANVHIEHEFNSDITGTVIIGYESLERDYATSDNMPISVADYLFRNEFSQFTIETQLSGELSNTFGWLVGAFVLEDEVDFGTNLQFLNSGLWQTDVQTDYVQERSSLGLFVSTDWTPIDWFTLEAGLRYSDDEVTFVGQTQNLDPFNVFGTPPTFFPLGSVFIGNPIEPQNPVVFNESLDDSQLTWKISGIVRPTPSLSLYGTISTGYKAGGFDGSTILTPQEALPIYSETVVAFEVGTKYWSDNGRFTAEANLFSYDFSDYQSTARLTVAGADTNVRANVADAKIEGAELALSAKPTDSLTFKASMTFINGEIENFLGTDDTINGNDLPFSPDTSWSFAAIYNTSINDQFDLNFQIDASSTGEHFQTINNNDEVDSYSLTNARIELESEGYTIALWARNITDEDYDVGFFPTTGLTPDTFLKGSPRTFGINFLINY